MFSNSNLHSFNNQSESSITTSINSHLCLLCLTNTSQFPTNIKPINMKADGKTACSTCTGIQKAKYFPSSSQTMTPIHQLLGPRSVAALKSMKDFMLTSLLSTKPVYCWCVFMKIKTISLKMWMTYAKKRKLRCLLT